MYVDTFISTKPNPVIRIKSQRTIENKQIIGLANFYAYRNITQTELRVNSIGQTALVERFIVVMSSNGIETFFEPYNSSRAVGKCHCRDNWGSSFEADLKW